MSWEKFKLGDIATCIQPGPFGSQLHNSDYSEVGTPIIMPKDMKDGKVTHDGLLRVGEDHVQRLSRHQVHTNNIMVARKGDVRKCVFISENEDGWMTGSDCLKVALDEALCVPKYIYYQLRSPSIGRYLESISIGATMPSINTGMLSGIEIFLPDLPTQHRIASILSAYDDLIENNRRQIKLLEEAAQRLYREWFVELRFPGHENVKIVDGVPEGWKAETIGNVCCTIGGGTPSTKEKTYYEGGNIPWVTPTDITRNGCLILLETEKKITEEGLAHSSAKMVPAWTILMTSRASVGYFGICEFPVCTNQGFISCIPYQENMRFYLLHNLMNRVDEIRAKAGGSTYLEISKSTFRDMKIIVPADEILNSFEESIQKLMMKMKNCKEQNRILTSARDRLLPKLMSGEVEV